MAGGGRVDPPATDVAIMTRLCEAYDRRAEMVAQVESDGLMIPGSVGQSRPHPILDKLFALETLITRYEGLWGFTPADRTRMGVAEVNRASAMDDFFFKRGQRDARLGRS